MHNLQLLESNADLHVESAIDCLILTSETEMTNL